MAKHFSHRKPNPLRFGMITHEPCPACLPRLPAPAAQWARRYRLAPRLLSSLRKEGFPFGSLGMTSAENCLALLGQSGQLLGEQEERTIFSRFGLWFMNTHPFRCEERHTLQFADGSKLLAIDDGPWEMWTPARRVR